METDIDRIKKLSEEKEGENLEFRTFLVTIHLCRLSVADKPFVIPAGQTSSRRP